MRRFDLTRKIKAFGVATAILALPVGASAAPTYYLVTTTNGRTSIDFTGHHVAGAAADALIPKLKTDPKSTLPGQSLKPADYPAFLKGIRSVKALTAGGVVDLELADARLEEGCSNATFVVGVKPSSPTAKGLAILNGSFPSKAKLRLLDDARKGSEKELATLAAKVWTSATGALEAQDRAILKAAAVGPEQLSFLPGTFPRGGAWLAWISRDLPPATPEKPGAYVAERTFRFAALVDAKGEILATLQSASVGAGDGIGQWLPNMIADVDGDGVEEIVASPSYYEGSSTVLYRGRDGKITETTLYGAGC